MERLVQPMYSLYLHLSPYAWSRTGLEGREHIIYIQFQIIIPLSVQFIAIINCNQPYSARPVPTALSYSSAHSIL